MNRTRHHRALIRIGLATMIACGLPLLVQGGRAGQGGAAQTKLAEAPPIGFFGSYRIAADKTDPSKLPIIGAWRINFDKSDPSMKAQGRFKETGTVIYTAVNGGVKQEVFLFYPPKDDSYKTVFTTMGANSGGSSMARIFTKIPRGRTVWVRPWACGSLIAIRSFANAPPKARSMSACSIGCLRMAKR